MPDHGRAFNFPGWRENLDATEPADDSISIFSGFHNYSPIADDEIRLVRVEPGFRDDSIRCVLFTRRSSERPRYTALSYEWGDARDQKRIYLNGRRVPIRRNLYDALRAIRRRDRHLTIWIDGLSINQGHNSEKSQQVAKMASIYRHAKRVICWLGKAKGDSDHVMDFINDPVRYDDLIKSLLEETDSGGLSINDTLKRLDFPLDSFQQIFWDRTYWKRMWVRQEIILAREPVIQCGCKSVSFERAANLMHTYTSVFCKDDSKLWQWNKRLDPLLNLSEGRRRLEVVKDSEWLLKELNLSRRALATDHRDKVFALLGLFHYNAASDAHRLRADYTLDVFEVYLRAFKYCVFQANGQPREGPALNVLCINHSTQHSEVDGLPSWLPCWSNYAPMPLWNFSVGYPTNQVRVNVRLRPDNRVLRCKGIEISVIRSLGLSFQDTKDEMEGEHLVETGNKVLQAWRDMASEYLPP